MLQSDNQSVVAAPIPASVAGIPDSRFHVWNWEGESLLIKPNSRFMVRHELVLKACANRGEPMRLRENDDTIDAISLLQERSEDGSAVHVIEKDDVIELTKVEIRPEKNLAALLFQRSNPDAPEPVFAHKKTKALRRVTKSPDEAEAVSAHLFLHLTERDGDTFYAHRAIMEEVPGLGRSYMHAVIANVVREMKYEYENGKGEKKQTYTLPVFQGVPSENLGKALEEGTIPFIELVRPANVEGLDTDGLVPRPERMRLSLKTHTMAKSLDIIKRVQGWRDTKNWRDLRVQIRTADKRSRMVPVAREEDAADVLFVHAEEIVTEKPLSQCTNEINNELMAYAETAFGSDIGWKAK